MNFLFEAPKLTRARVALAFAVAVIADAIQVMLGPLGWTFADEIIDLIAMALITYTLGFHPLLLPTFIIEVVPVVDMLPTWTACTAAVVVLRRRAQDLPSNPERPMKTAVVVEDPPRPSS